MLCFAIVALSFEALENLLYGGQNGVVTAIVLSIVVVVKLVRWKKKGALNVPVQQQSDGTDDH